MAAIKVVRTDNPEMLALGQKGSQYIPDTATYTGTWGAIQCIDDCVGNFFSNLRAIDKDGTVFIMKGDTTALPLKAGTVIFGSWWKIILASGKVIAYEA